MNNLYELIKQKSKEKGRPLKIICDWDECVMPVRPWFTWLHLKTKQKVFKEFFEDFWERATFISSSAGGSNLTEFKNATPEEKEAIEQWVKMKKERKTNFAVDFYASPQRYQAPFLSTYEQLLKAYKEDLISYLLIFSSHRPGKLVSENQGKIDWFNKTFGKLPNTNVEIYEANERGAQGQKTNTPHRHEWIRDNHPDFDIYIDDGYTEVKKTSKLFPDKTYVLPDYKFSRDLKAPNIYHVKTTVSDLKIEDFEKAAQELKDKKVREDQSKLAEPKNYWPWIIGVSIVGGILIVGLIIYLLVNKIIQSP